MAKNSKEKQKEYDAKRAGLRTRNWLVVFYPEDLPENWREMVDSLNFRWIESPIHDKDFNADGTPKRSHVHALCMFGVIQTVQQVKTLFGELFGWGGDDGDSVIGVPTPQKCSDRVASVRYFAHLDHPDKAQYNRADIIGHNGADVNKCLEMNEEEVRETMFDIQDFVVENKIVEYIDLCCAFQANPDYHEWYTFITCNHTFWITNLLRSHRNKLYPKEDKTVFISIDHETGKVTKAD